MPLLDLTRQTNLTVDATATLDVQGTIDIVGNGLEIDSSAVTFSAAEANILTGATLSTTELNYVTGVTSSIQTQLNNISDGTTSFLGDVSIGENGNPYDLTVYGNLAVLGSGIIFDTERIQIEDPIMQLNYIAGVAQAGVNGGMEIGRSATDNARMIWNESSDRWELGVIGTMTNVVGVNTTDTLENKALAYTNSNTINIGTITNQRVLTTNADLTTSLDALDTEWLDLATSASAKGANLVNIEDANANTSETTVEGALKEIYEINWTLTAGLGLYGNASGQLKDGITATFNIEEATYTTVTASGLDVDTTTLYANLDDQAMTWTQLQSLNAGATVPTGQDITLTDAPVDATDAVNKNYVDTQAGLWPNFLVNALAAFNSTTVATLTGYNLKTGQTWSTDDFLVAINGQAIQKAKISTIANNVNDVDITFTGLEYNLEAGDEILLWGPLQTAP